MHYNCYVRGHGGEKEQKYPPSKHLPINLVTVGQMGSTMSDKVADGIIYNHYDDKAILSAIDKELIIYWTKDEMEEYDRTHGREFHYTNPKLGITPYNDISAPIALYGDREIGECGVCYWDKNRAELVWLRKIGHDEELLLAEILSMLAGMLKEGDTINLYWTACLSAKYWSGHRKKVSRNPTKTFPPK